ncbi:MAG: DNA-binding response regulator, partial [Sphingobacteriaceae bacterium]
AALEAMLPAMDFVRIHRSYIAALMKVRSYTASHVQVQGHELPIGKLYQREVFRALETDKLQ